jgi:hypothetical protein
MKTRSVLEKHFYAASKPRRTMCRSNNEANARIARRNVKETP